MQQFPGFAGVILQLLWNRGLKTKERIEQFLAPDYERHTPNPLLFTDMEKAVQRIQRAVKNHERIQLYGDFDADGICGSIILFEFLREQGAQVAIYIPDRLGAGHGLTKESVEEIAAQNVSLLITIDCGISNVQEAAFAQEKGMDVVMLDHHLPPSVLPAAYAVVDAKRADDHYPFKWLCGTGVAFKTIQALMRGSAFHERDTQDTQGSEKRFLDLVAIATIADVVPLTDENRLFVKEGLKLAQETRRPGLKALFEVARVAQKGMLDERAVAFSLVPRINAASRMDHANTAVRLFTAPSYEEALAWAEVLDAKNTERQKVVGDILREVMERLERAPSIPAVIIEQGDGWNPGVLGIVANKVLDQWQRPVFIFSRDAKTGMSRGSARSPEGFDVVEAMRSCGEERYVEFGGHAQAAGATVSDAQFERMAEGIREFGEEWFRRARPQPALLVEAELLPQELSPRLGEFLEQFAPFGQGNPVPRFLVSACEVVGKRELGNAKNGKGSGNGNGTGSAPRRHLQFELLAGDRTVKALAFGAPEHFFHIRNGDRIDVACEILYDEWQGRKELKLKIIDVRRAVGV